MENKRYLKIFKTEEEYNIEMDKDQEVSIIGDPHVVMFGDDNTIVFSDSTRLSRQYFTIVAVDDITIKMSRNKFQYYIEDEENKIWKTYNYNEISVNKEQRVRIKINNPNINEDNGIGTFDIIGEFKIEGNIMSLLYGDDFVKQKDLTDKQYAFKNLFKDCKSLISAKNIVLQSIKLSEDCYANMFEGCTSLIDCPALPATTLSTGCYQSMFSGCTSLTVAPELPATKLAGKCYKSMFEGCTSLTVAPILHSDNVATQCYQSMFSGCTSLTVAPELPATTLYVYCYRSMFSGCTSLTVTPELPATKLAGNCYRSMFSGCTSLTDAPELPATKLSVGCYQDMFSGCTSLTVAPELPATKLAGNCYQSMFSGCTSLTDVPKLPATTLSAGCYQDMFSGCTSLTVAPELPSTKLSGNCYNSMFSGCTSLTVTPELPATKLAGNCYRSMFSGCTSLTVAPELPATTLSAGCYQDMFKNCTSLNNIPALNAVTLEEDCYQSMFEGCTSLTLTQEQSNILLKSVKLKRGCYAYMFKDCISLTKAPKLPASELVYDCYSYMFEGCINLNYIEMLAKNNIYKYNLDNWVRGVSQEGIFVKNISNISLSTGDYSGIPNGWTVKEYCVTPSFVNPLNKTVNFNFTSGIYTPNKNNYNLLDYNKYSVDDILSMKPERNIYINLIFIKDNDYHGDILKQNILWENNYTFEELLKINDLSNLKDLITKIAVVIVDVLDIEESNYYYNNINFEKEYFTIVALENGLTVKLSNNKSSYRIDDGRWKNLSALTATPPVNAGQKIQFRITNPTIDYGNGGIGSFIVNKRFNVEGNIMSLLYGDNFIGEKSLSGKDGVFEYLFESCSTLIDAKNLILPATTLSNNCYYGMFSGCKSLTTTPKLPATILATGCYQYMFQDCTSLKTAPALPAITLVTSCYNSMFENCSGLTSAPALPAKTLATSCYMHMFQGCTKLNYIKMLATNISASGCLRNWVRAVASTGTFVKHIDMNSLLIGESGIPNDNWKVESI